MTPQVSVFEYRPTRGDASSFLQAFNSPRFLLVGTALNDGEGLPDGYLDASECRHSTPASEALPAGSYRFRLDSGDGVMLVTSGASAGPVERGGCTPDSTSALEAAAAWFEHLWERAETIEVEPDGDGLRGRSEALGLDLCWQPPKLRLWDLAAGAWLLDNDDQIARADAAEAELAELRGRLGHTP